MIFLGSRCLERNKTTVKQQWHSKELQSKHLKIVTQYYHIYILIISRNSCVHSPKNKYKNPGNKEEEKET